LIQRKSIICCGEESVLRHVSRILGVQFIVHSLRTPAHALARLQKENDVHAFLTDHTTSPAIGLDVLNSAREVRPEVRRLLMTHYGDLTGIIGGLHSGVIQHLVQLPIRDAELLAAVCPVIPLSTPAATHSFA